MSNTENKNTVQKLRDRMLELEKACEEQHMVTRKYGEAIKEIAESLVVLSELPYDFLGVLNKIRKTICTRTDVLEVPHCCNAICGEFLCPFFDASKGTPFCSVVHFYRHIKFACKDEAKEGKVNDK